MLKQAAPSTFSEAEDPRVVRTRKLLTQALKELLGEKSFQSLTVSEIAERATINRVTFYSHFQDKYDLFEFSIHEMIQERIEAQLGKHSAFSQANLLQTISLVAGFVAEMDSHCPPPHGQLQPLMERQITSAIHQLVQGWLQDAPKLRGRAPSTDQVAMITSWAIYGAALQWSQHAEQQSLEAFADQVLPLIATPLKPFFAESASSVSSRPGAGGTSLLTPQYLRVQFHLS